MKTPLNDAILQSDLDTNGFGIIGLDGVGGSLPDGGTAGQLLQKQSSTDGDADWATVSSGGVGGNSVQGAIISVKDPPYNATGDGVTDDTDAIKSAISDIVNVYHGGTVFFPKGIYLCNGAYDVAWNSILQIPGIATSNPAVTIELRGENQPAWQVVEPGFNPANHSTLKTTKAGVPAVANPAFLAGSQRQATGTTQAYALKNNIFVIIRNLAFILPDNPVMDGIQLSGVGWAIIENTTVFAGGGEPTTDSTGVWMPVTINWGVNRLNQVRTAGFKWGFRTGELCIVTASVANWCYCGWQFLPAVYGCKGDVWVEGCNYGVRFAGRCTIDITMPTEHHSTGWYATVNDLYDPDNYATGIYRFMGANGLGGGYEAPALSGGDGLTVISLFTGDIRLPLAPGGGGPRRGFITGNGTVPVGGAAGTFLSKTSATDYDVGWASTLYIGTDARLVPITGGVKLEARNTGTGVWIEAARWTNP